MPSTANCREFIVNFQIENPQIEEARFGEMDGESLEALHNPNNWKRIYKVRPDSETDMHEPREDDYSVYTDGCIINRHAETEYKTYLAPKDVAWERRFECKPFDGQVAYLILEKHDGTLVFGPYVGD